MPDPKRNTFSDFVYPLAGVLIVSAGCFWAYRPLGPIVFGAFLLTAAFLGKRR